MNRFCWSILAQVVGSDWVTALYSQLGALRAMLQRYMEVVKRGSGELVPLLGKCILMSSCFTTKIALLQLLSNKLAATTHPYSVTELDFSLLFERSWFPSFTTSAAMRKAYGINRDFGGVHHFSHSCISCAGIRIFYICFLCLLYVFKRDF